MAEYYIDTHSGFGTGTISDPFGLSDLQIRVSSDPIRDRYVGGNAFQSLTSGDTLYFRAGDYYVLGGSGALSYGWAMLGLPRGGISGYPITIRNYPGEQVNIINQQVGANQPIFCGGNPDVDWVVYKGLHIYLASGNVNTDYACFNIYGSNNEICYNECVGQYANTGDNHECIILQGVIGFIPCTNNWIHHNEIRNCSGPDGIQNSAGIKIYKNGYTLIEDNYIHHNNVGIYDKDSGSKAQGQLDGTHQTIMRRNYVVNNRFFSLSFPQQNFYVCAQCTIQCYDNMIDGIINVGRFQNDTQIYNNLLTNIQLSGNIYNQNHFDHTNYPCESLWAMDNIFRTQVWNNVLFNPDETKKILAWEYVYGDFQNPAITSSPLSYMDYNVYAGNPYYFWGYYGYTPPLPGTSSYVNQWLSNMNLSQIQSSGLEINSSTVSSPTGIYQNLTNYQLLSQWQTAGRYGDNVGPRVSITGILMNTSRYGPQALGQIDNITYPIFNVLRRLKIINHISMK